MALKAGYYGLKRSLLNKVKAMPGIKSIGAGLSLNSTTGELEATGATISIEANPEGAATENLIKLGLGETVYAVPDASKTYQTDDATESAIVDADYIPFLDSSAASGSGAPKKSTWSNFISKIKAKITEFVTWEANNILGAKNLLPNFAVSTGIFTVNSDGTVLVNGETSTATLKLTDRQALNFALPAGSYILSGCPSGGDITTYFMNCGRNATKGDPTSSWVAIGNDTGDGLSFTLESAADVQVSIEIRANADNLLFKPMIRLAADTDDTYVPYAMTNRELSAKDSLAITSANANVTIGDETYCQAFLNKSIVVGSIQFVTSAEIAQYASIASIALGQVPVNKGKFVFAALSTNDDVYRVTIEAANTNTLGVWLNKAIPSGKTCKFTFVLFV